MSAQSTNRASAGNKRTGLILAAVALAFFFAIVLKYWLAK